MRAAPAIDTPDTVQPRLWLVELEADGGAVCYTWQGYAADSIEASNAAKLEHLAGSIESAEAWQARGLRVRNCTQAGI